jgi:site-specific DNA recombinase
MEDFQRVQRLHAAADRRPALRKPHRARRPYVLRGMVYCGVCDRRMQGHWANEESYYRCRFPQEYALANKIRHPRNVYLREAAVLEPLDGWLAQVFAPSRLTQTLHELAQSQDAPEAGEETAIEAARRALTECDRRLARYRAALEAGTDPALIARWTAEVNAQRVMAEAKLPEASGRRSMSEQEIAALVAALGNLLDVLRNADPVDKAKVYQQLGLTLTYKPNAHTVLIESRPTTSDMGIPSCPRGDLNPHALFGH